MKVSRILSVLCLLFLMACASQKEQEIAKPLIPMPKPAIVIDPDDGKLAQAVESYLKESGAPLSSRYDFTRVDLDGDGRREGLVMMKGPYHTWCNLHGCRMVVFKASNTAFKPLTNIGPVRGPVIVSDSKTNGWRDLIIHISGRLNERTRDVILRYNGRSYPKQPDTQPALYYAQNSIPGHRIFP